MFCVNCEVCAMSELRKQNLEKPLMLSIRSGELLQPCRSLKYLNVQDFLGDSRVINEIIVEAPLETYQTCNPAGIDLFKINNRNTRTMCEIYS